MPLYLPPSTGGGGGGSTEELAYVPASLDTDGTAYLTTPDAADLDITGDIEIVFKFAMPDYNVGSSRSICAKRSSGAGLHWQVSNVASTGNIALSIRTGGADHFFDSTGANPGFVDGATYWVRIRRVASTGVVTMDYAEDSALLPASDSDAWTAMTVTGTQTAGNFDTNAAPVEFGTDRAATVGVIDAKLYRLIIRDGIDGTIVADCNNVLARSPFRDVTGKTWTLAGSGGGWSL